MPDDLRQRLNRIITELEALRDSLPVVPERKLVLCLDAGHGGTHPETGQYMTPPQQGRYYVHFKDDGTKDFEIREGDINRKVAGYLQTYCEAAGIAVVPTYHPYLDSPLSERIRIANQTDADTRKQGKFSVFVSLHVDAQGKDNQTPFVDGKPQRSTANGFSVFTSRGLTRSDAIAEELYRQMERLHGDRIHYRRDRSDGDSDFEQNFAVLYYTTAPAILIENLFFTHYQNAQLLLDPDYQKSSARAIFETLLWWEQQVHK